ncbi:tRNA-guanine transglycosylase DpdA [Variovorax humicola]|uniref:tRNA-guanine transglycosylase DpdA n=1 Tax=Variovorax humicola TaxID=1769758 RepID=A0ABU8W3U9_9BURK
MKFLYSDTQDYVDPAYDFINDRNAPTRERYWGDVYAHEMMKPPPYDGLLVSMSAVRQAEGVASSKVRYSTKEEQRMLRDGARKFLRYDGPEFKDCMLMGDCGAFAYVEHEKPAYSPEEVVEFYIEAGFTHGVSPDHIIFDCDLSNPPKSKMPEATQKRFRITLDNAKAFLKLVKEEGHPFEPMGAVQGWSPASMAEAAVELEKMGYKYLAIGGLVPLRVDAIHVVLRALRDAIKPETKIHLLGFAKADQIQEFTGYGITSFDSTSPLIRAFKDNKSNYYMGSPTGTGLDYYTAIRIPQAIENFRLVQGIKRGIFSAEDLQRREQKALKALRSFDRGEETAAKTLTAVMDYHRFLVEGESEDTAKHQRELAKMRELVGRTLQDAPWKRCGCDVCRDAGVEVIIFRSSNRNKRRGFHNLGVYHKHLKATMENAQ